MQRHCAIIALKIEFSLIWKCRAMETGKGVLKIIETERVATTVVVNGLDEAPSLAESFLGI